MMTVTDEDESALRMAVESVGCKAIGLRCAWRQVHVPKMKLHRAK